MTTGKRILTWFRTHRTVREMLLLAALYVTYTVSRTLADNQLGPALARAGRIIDVEKAWHMSVEPWANALFVEHKLLGIAGDYWYASAHYVVTAVVIVWLFARHPDKYLPARRALVYATLVALAFYLTAPTAPPRFGFGFTDVMHLHSSVGWWGADASAPKGLGGLTNELAAFPSMHAGWSLWVALALASVLTNRFAKIAVFLYPAITGIVVIGTGNHWTLDVVIGFAITGAAWWMTSPTGARRLFGRSPAPAAVASGQQVADNAVGQ
ncbi:phosphatase PAP2 family protein [Nocardioides sp.]|jgi:hypothetical protein|uniref:phosphatase PAP2 family protein n=1 Tax=Nocardioides sp. TaxID=35761 RepID=UPI0026309802|nr:phosphatase PAP2 family protein [Nocardioides sp.]